MFDEQPDGDPHGECAAEIHRLAAALENCRLFAARHRAEPWAKDVLRFCTEGGVAGSPLRASEVEAARASPASIRYDVLYEIAATFGLDYNAVCKCVGASLPAPAQISDLIDKYWDLAYAEGKEGRTQDTEDGAAQRTRAEIDRLLRAPLPAPLPDEEWLKEAERLVGRYGHAVALGSAALNEERELLAHLRARHGTGLETTDRSQP